MSAEQPGLRPGQPSSSAVARSAALQGPHGAVLGAGGRVLRAPKAPSSLHRCPGLCTPIGIILFPPPLHTHTHTHIQTHTPPPRFSFFFCFVFRVGFVFLSSVSFSVAFLYFCGRSSPRRRGESGGRTAAGCWRAWGRRGAAPHRSVSFPGGRTAPAPTPAHPAHARRCGRARRGGVGRGAVRGGPVCRRAPERLILRAGRRGAVRRGVLPGPRGGFCRSAPPRSCGRPGLAVWRPSRRCGPSRFA